MADNQVQTALFNPGPLHTHRFEIKKILENIPVKTGDILCRLDNYKYLGLISFSKIVCQATNSKWDHSAVICIENGDIQVLEINDAGCVRMDILDWVDLTYNKEFAIYRLKDDSDSNISLIGKEINNFFTKDPDYDFTFGNDDSKCYCTKGVSEIYQKAGFVIMQPMLIKDILKQPFWYWTFVILNHIILEITGKGFDTKKPMYFLGNSDCGMLASPFLRLVKVINFE